MKKGQITEIREIIENDRYYLQAEYCHPERVMDQELEHAEQTAEKWLQTVTDDQIRDAIAETHEASAGDYTPIQVIQTLAGKGADYSGRTTITVTARIRKG